MARITKAQQAANRQLLVEALRSGKYKQVPGVLHRKTISSSGKITNHHCCLGVACEIAIANGVKLDVTEGFNELHPETTIINLFYGDNDSFLPSKVQTWLGFKDSSGGLIDRHDLGESCLSGLNDSGKYSFKKIAKVIEDGKVAVK